MEEKIEAVIYLRKKERYPAGLDYVVHNGQQQETRGGGTRFPKS